MGIFDEMFSQPDSEQELGQQRFIDRALGTYYKWKIADRVADKGLDYFTGGDETRNLDNIDKKLSIAQRRKALGLPWDDDDYERAINEGLSFTQKGAVAAFGKHVADRVPTPGFLTPPASSGLMETRFPKNFAAAEAGTFLSRAGSRVGGKYGSALGRIFGVFGK